MNVYLAEFIGTALLLLMGNGVVANVVLRNTKGNSSGWIVICAGWGFAVYTAVLCVGEISGAHINPAVTVGILVAGKIESTVAVGYIAAQLAGAFVGAALAFVFYHPHYVITGDPDAKLATFCTAPQIRNLPSNFLSETVGTFVLVYAVLLMSPPQFELASKSEPVEIGLGSIGALPVGLIVFAIGLSLGGTTGHAINPARDIAPRLAHALLPVPGKRDSDWGYAAVPVAGPILGGILAALLSMLHQSPDL